MGPLVNVYDEAALDIVAGRGATRFCLPPELPLSSVSILPGAAASRRRAALLPGATFSNGFRTGACGAAFDPTM